MILAIRGTSIRDIPTIHSLSKIGQTDQSAVDTAGEQFDRVVVDSVFNLMPACTRESRPTFATQLVRYTVLNHRQILSAFQNTLKVFNLNLTCNYFPHF